MIRHNNPNLLLPSRPPHITWFAVSPDPGSNCLCSVCGRTIHDVPIRIFDDDCNREARFHTECYNQVSSVKIDPADCEEQEVE